MPGETALDTYPARIKPHMRFCAPIRPTYVIAFSFTPWLDVVIGIDTNIEVIVVSLTTWEAHHSPVVSFPGR